MEQGYRKYRPAEQITLPDRQWPSHVIDKAPIWCSVDLRDGNQSLVTPMTVEEKLTYFKALCRMGFKEIEVGFPAASHTELAIVRRLIEENHIPDDVTIQVMVQAREELICQTFEAIRGARRVILHFYNSTSELQRRVVFHTDLEGVKDIAVKAAKLVRKLAEQTDTEIIYEYSPESFSGTSPDDALAVCAAVMEVLEPTEEHPMILNLPNTVEQCTPNVYADKIEYFIRHLPNRKAAIISLHPHNDRGTGVAAAELGLLAGGERIEGTLFGNGERTGNLDIVNVGLNLYTQGVDPHLDFSRLPALRDMFEGCTKMHLSERQPYAGELVFTAFSGAHQDAINKGFQYQKAHASDVWEIPYLPIDPADVGREYEPIIRINSQSGKGGAAFILSSRFGYFLPNAMHPEFGHKVKAVCEREGRELTPEEILDVFRKCYLDVPPIYSIEDYTIYEENGTVRFEGVLVSDGHSTPLDGTGNGPIDSFFNALHDVGFPDYRFLDYTEHAISEGSDSRAIAYIQLRRPDGRTVFGVGIANNINLASVKGVIGAINRAEAEDRERER